MDCGKGKEGLITVGYIISTKFPNEFPVNIDFIIHDNLTFWIFIGLGWQTDSLRNSLLRRLQHCSFRLSAGIFKEKGNNGKIEVLSAP